MGFEFTIGMSMHMPMDFVFISYKLNLNFYYMEYGIFGTVRHFLDFFWFFGHLRPPGIIIPPPDSFYAAAG